MALCTQADIEHRLGIDITAEPDPAVTALIDAATGHIEREFGGPVEADDYTESHTRLGTHIFLRRHPVNSIASVTEDGDALVEDIDFVWSSSGSVTRVRDGYRIWWKTARFRAIEVTYNAGFVTVPADIVDVCANMAASALRRAISFGEHGSSLAGAESESVSDYSVSYLASITDPNSIVMTDEQRNVIRYYRMPVVA